ncbi:MAG: response regulator, partial [Chloroflexales bacterium]|nr:response regulator [Chloroflexales bacterium]
MQHILLVDDEKTIAEIVKGRLEREGFVVRAVTSGEEALAELAQARFDA